MFKFVKFSKLLAPAFLLATICLENGWAENPQCQWKLRCNQNRTVCFDVKMQPTSPAASKPTKRFWKQKKSDSQCEFNATLADFGGRMRMVDGPFLDDFDLGSLVQKGESCGTLPPMPQTGPSQPPPSRGSGRTAPPGSHQPGKTEQTTTPTTTPVPTTTVGKELILKK